MNLAAASRPILPVAVATPILIPIVAVTLREGAAVLPKPNSAGLQGAGVAVALRLYARPICMRDRSIILS